MHACIHVRNSQVHACLLTTLFMSKNVHPGRRPTAIECSLSWCFYLSRPLCQTSSSQHETPIRQLDCMVKVNCWDCKILSTGTSMLAHAWLESFFRLVVYLLVEHFNFPVVNYRAETKKKMFQHDSRRMSLQNPGIRIDCHHIFIVFHLCLPIFLCQ